MADLAYLRVSGASQVDGDGPERQLLKIQTAVGAEILPYNVFFEEGIAGKTELAGRPALMRLFEAAKPGDRVWVERADRLARDTITSELLIQEFQKVGVTVYSAEGGVDLTAGDPSNPTAKLIRQILAAVSEWEKDSIVIKLKVARERKKAKGFRVDGRKPYGEKPGEAEILRTIFHLRDNHGFTPSLICNHLNNEGFRTRKGTPWNSGTISRILTRQEVTA